MRSYRCRLLLPFSRQGTMFRAYVFDAKHCASDFSQLVSTVQVAAHRKLPCQVGKHSFYQGGEQRSLHRHSATRPLRLQTFFSHLCSCTTPKSLAQSKTSLSRLPAPLCVPELDSLCKIIHQIGGHISQTARYDEPYSIPCEPDPPPTRVPITACIARFEEDSAWHGLSGYSPLLLRSS